LVFFWLLLFFKREIFKTLNFFRRLFFSFNINFFFLPKFFFNYNNSLFSLLNSVHSLSSNLNFKFYMRPDIKGYRKASFFQDYTMHWNLNMHPKAQTFNIFIDRFLYDFNASKQPPIYFDKRCLSMDPFAKKKDSFVSHAANTFNYDIVKPNFKNFWFLDYKSQKDFKFLFLKKHIVTRFFFFNKFYIKSLPLFFKAKSRNKRQRFKKHSKNAYSKSASSLFKNLLFFLLLCKDLKVLM